MKEQFHYMKPRVFFMSPELITGTPDTCIQFKLSLCAVPYPGSLVYAVSFYALFDISHKKHFIVTYCPSRAKRGRR